MAHRTGLGMWSMLQRRVGRLDGDIKRDGLVRGIGNGVAGARWGAVTNHDTSSRTSLSVARCWWLSIVK